MRSAQSLCKVFLNPIEKVVGFKHLYAYLFPIDWIISGLFSLIKPSIWLLTNYLLALNVATVSLGDNSPGLQYVFV